uniref:Ribosomal protein S21 n=1 Tax=Laticauda laticaudata TaxID=8630 RepID=A0A8C5S0U9_LATLA
FLLFVYFFSFSSASNRIIGAKDHASIQINVAEVDKATGRVNGQFKAYAICGAIRRMVSLIVFQLLEQCLYYIRKEIVGISLLLQKECKQEMLNTIH